MSETKFTKENWRLISDFGSGFLGVQIGRQGGFLVQGIDADQAIANAHLIAAAPEMYEALESTNKELEWAINEINRLYAANHNYHSLDEPERIDMETCHDNAVLLAKARGES